MYACDTVLESTNNKIFIALAYQSALLEVNEGLEQNKLTLNVTKTRTMSHFRAQKKNEKRTVIYFLNETRLKNVESFNHLLIHLNCKLSFRQHIDKVKIKVLQFCGVFFHQLRKFPTVQQLLFAYKSYVQPIIQYGVIVYANTDKTKLLELEMKIKRQIRIIFYKHKMDSIIEIMLEKKIYCLIEYFA